MVVVVFVVAVVVMVVVVVVLVVVVIVDSLAPDLKIGHPNVVCFVFYLLQSDQIFCKGSSTNQKKTF